jgi:D-beta-D-heptose 7-phosphate kinase/D-beta-D-heptose 1-phosphate adenosyltransferase
MKSSVSLKPARAKQLLAAAKRSRILVVGDVMLDQFIWGGVSRISPEAPVPVVEFARESYMPGGAANVARNLSALGVKPQLFGAVGRDVAASQLRKLLGQQSVGCAGLVVSPSRHTSIKTRIVAQQQQVVRVDRESRGDLNGVLMQKLLATIRAELPRVDAIIIGDYGKGVVTQPLADELRNLCRERGIWLSFDPKPVHKLNLAELSLITPNRKETFELAGLTDDTKNSNPLVDRQLMRATEKLLAELRPAVLLITLGELGMLLCQRGERTLHIPTVAQEVFDVSGAGDTVIATFTLAITAGASPLEAALLANHAAGIVVGKVGTATVSSEELAASFNR